MLFKAILLLVVISAASAQVRVTTRPCANGQPEPLWFESAHCTATVCTLTRGQVFTGRAAFVPDRAFSDLTISLSATVFGIAFPLQIPVGYENACGFLESGRSCPTTIGEEHVWGLQFPMGSTYPEVQGIIVTRKFYLLI